MKLIDFLNQIKEESKSYISLEKVPEGFLMQGLDSRLTLIIAVLNEVFGSKTQWSCQGHRDSLRWNLAYIRFYEGYKAPIELSQKLLKLGFSCGYMRPFDDEREVYVIRAYNDEEKLSDLEKQNKNDLFLKELNSFAEERISILNSNS